jgi:hypothetical protein
LTRLQDNAVSLKLSGPTSAVKLKQGSCVGSAVLSGAHVGKLPISACIGQKPAYELHLIGLV